MDNDRLAETVLQLQAGNREAFDCLVRLYHAQARYWALRIVRDAHLAEDVVQESFLRVKISIGTLRQPDKFRAWLRQLVRRQALNAVRGRANGTVPAGDRAEREETGGAAEADPLQQLLKREYEDELLIKSVHALRGQARALFAAQALESATTEELAIRFHLKKSNVYNIMSRSRARANEERFLREVERHIAGRRRANQPASRQLEPPRYDKPYALISILIHEVLRIAGDSKWTLTELMGLSGDAFRLTVPVRCSWQGISTYDWSYSAYRMLERLGYGGTCYGRPGADAVSPERQAAMLSSIQETIDRGLPVIAWNLAINEFGYLHGYNDEEQTLAYSSYGCKTRGVRYDRLGRSPGEPPLFLLAVRKRTALPATEDEVLASIIRHAGGQEPQIRGFAFGFQGYRIWLEAAEQETLDLQGHAYQVAIAAEARQQAALYLHGLSARADRPERRRLLAEAAECYKRAAGAFSGLYPSFPFGYGGSHAGRFSAIREGLLAAYEAERQGVSLLEQNLRRL